MNQNMWLRFFVKIPKSTLFNSYSMNTTSGGKKMSAYMEIPEHNGSISLDELCLIKLGD